MLFQVACQPARRDLRGHWFFCNCYYEVLTMLTISFNEEHGEISLEDDGAGHELIKVWPGSLHRKYESAQDIIILCSMNLNDMCSR